MICLLILFSYLFRLTFMADKRKRKLCKIQSEEDPLVVDKQPIHIPTGKLIELLNKKRRSLRKKLGNEKIETMDQELYEDVVPRNTRSNRRMLVIDDSPQFEKHVAPKSSPTTNTRRSLQTLFEASSPENIVSPQPKVDPFVSPKVTKGTKESRSNQNLGSPATNTRGSLRRNVENETTSDEKKNLEVHDSPKKRTVTSLQSPTKVATKEDYKSPTAPIRKSRRLQSLAVEFDSPKGNENVEAYQEEPLPTNVASSTEKATVKRKRGPTKMKSIGDGHLAVEFNSKGQPIGDSSIHLSSFLGPLVREIVPVTIPDWRKVTKGMKAVLWQSVQV
ncbi:hypothetical protein TorRG33x02_182610 [Trema orientale]|uniref:Uncharacterized protein n=1 Tax=Trema orientale TaxID=63057 RepID=A0A2P5EK96_TREOI|nr:hypothetical protein TorRG33x02_182610 [Trema orientale]